jgi:hypothetical protein
VTTPRTNDLTVFSLELGGGGYLLEISEQKDTGSLDSWCTARVFRLYEVGNFNRADPIRTIAEGKPAFVLGGVGAFGPAMVSQAIGFLVFLAIMMALAVGFA